MAGATVIRAAHYGETVARLKQDPIVKRMMADVYAAGPEKQAELAPDGKPVFSFMQAANERYREMGGTDGGHIGAIAEAIFALIADVEAIGAEIQEALR